MFKCLYLDVETVCLHYYENSTSDNYAYTALFACFVPTHRVIGRITWTPISLRTSSNCARCGSWHCQVIQLFEMRRETFELRVNTFGREDKIKQARKIVCVCTPRRMTPYVQITLLRSWCAFNDKLIVNDCRVSAIFTSVIAFYLSL